MNIKKILYIIFGCISFGLGAVGAVLPVLPTFPFLIFAAFCFARSSKKLDKWFKGTKLYKIIYVFLTIFLYLLKCPQSLIL